MEVFIGLVAIVFGVLQIILFFKVWGMTNDVSDMKDILIRIANNTSRNYVTIPQTTHEETSPKHNATVQPSKKEATQKSEEQSFVVKSTNKFSDTNWGTFSGSLTKTELRYYFDADGEHYTFSAINYKNHVNEEGIYSVNGDTISLKPSNCTQQRILTYSSADDALIPSDSPKELYKRWN